MIRVITFDSGDFHKSAALLDSSARKFGAGDVAIYQPEHLDPFFMHNILMPLLKDSRGFGWWVWKSYICLGHMLIACKEGDYLIYSDAGQEIVGDLQAVCSAMDEDILFCSNGWQHSHWCKRETFYTILPGKPHNDAKQVQASFIIFKVTDKVKEFLQEWYAYSIMPGMIDNIPRGTQFPEFREHRHDQAILTCLQIKYGYKLHWFPSTTALHLRTPEGYGVTINHHRKRDNEW